jgi:hypothetical protein
MKLETIQNAIDEAKRFIDRAEKAKAMITVKPFKDPEHGFYEQSNGQANAACKRASLDLSKALSTMRKN